MPFAHTANVVGTPTVTGGKNLPLLCPPPGVSLSDFVPVRAVSGDDASVAAATCEVHAPTPVSKPSEYVVVVVVPASAAATDATSTSPATAVAGLVSVKEVAPAALDPAVVARCVGMAPPVPELLLTVWVCRFAPSNPY